MKRFLTGVATAVALLTAIGVGSAVAGTGTPERWLPPHDTIVKVTGDAANGFGIYHYDGTALYPPTESEARAECLEYDHRIDRARCIVEFRTWYADLADMKIALRWANR